MASGNCDPDSRPATLPSNAKVLGWASFLNDVASEMVYPLLPLYLVRVLGGNEAMLGWIEGAADSTASFVKLWSGRLSDRSGGRKKFVVIGYMVATIARPLASAITAPWQLFGLRVSDRIGKGVRTAPRDAMIADSTTEAIRGRAFGFQRGMDHLGAAIGPVLATIFLWYWPNQLRWLFALTLLPGMLVAGLVSFGLREPARQSTTRAAGFQWTLAPFGGGYRRYLLAIVVFTLGNSSDLFLMLRAGDSDGGLGVPTALLPMLWCLFHVVKSTGSFAVGRSIERIGSRPLILFGWLLYALVYLGFGLASESWHAWALFVAYGLFYAATEPAERTWVSRLVGQDQWGSAYGWFNFAIGVSALPSSVIFGWLYLRFGALMAFGWSAGLALIACVVLLTIPSNQLRQDEAKTT